MVTVQVSSASRDLMRDDWKRGTGKHETGKRGTNLHGWKTRDQ